RRKGRRPGLRGLSPSHQEQTPSIATKHTQPSATRINRRSFAAKELDGPVAGAGHPHYKQGAEEPDHNKGTSDARVDPRQSAQPTRDHTDDRDHDHEAADREPRPGEWHGSVASFYGSPTRLRNAHSAVSRPKKRSRAAGRSHRVVS